MTYGSLFSGIGGLDLGLQRAGLECRFQVESDPFCTKVLEKHWPEVKRYGDITKLDGRELEQVDLLAGGFPCQDLSQAGKRVGIEGSRSGLWFEFARLIGELRPRYVLAENVPGLLTSRGAMGRVIGELARFGYVGCWFCLRASEFGASHLRKRVFIVAQLANSGYWRVPDWTRHARRVENERLPEREGPEGNGNELVDALLSSERRRDARELGIPEAEEHREALQRQRNRNAADDQGGHLGNAQRSRRQTAGIGRDQHAGSESEARCGVVADPSNRFVSEPRRRPEGRDGLGSAGEILSYSDIGRREGERSERVFDGERSPFRHDPNGCGMPFAPGPSDSRWRDIIRERPDLAPALESQICRVANGIPDWMERAMSDRTNRLSRLGNAVVPQCAEYIARRILEAAS